MEAFGRLVAWLVLLVGSGVTRGLGILWMIEWFVTPTTGFVAPGFVWCCGVSLFTMFLPVSSSSETKTPDKKLEDGYAVLFALWVMIGCARIIYAWSY